MCAKVLDNIIFDSNGQDNLEGVKFNKIQWAQFVKV